MDHRRWYGFEIQIPPADIAIDQGKITGVGSVHEDGDVTLDAMGPL